MVVCRNLLKTKTDDSYSILFGKKKDKKGKSVLSGSAAVLCKEVLKQFKIDTDAAYSTKVTEFDENETALYLKLTKLEK